jgi:hypothetical protein
MALTMPTCFVWGIADDTSKIYLPEPWIIRMKSDNFAMLINRDTGREYYLQRNGSEIWGLRKRRAGFWDVIKSQGRLNRGEWFCDEREVVTPCLR